jgi:hypothetical protein
MAFDVGILLSQWEQAGVFEFVLPFLLIFAIIFGILNTTNILSKHKGIQVIIAIIIGLMSITYSSRMNFSLGRFMGEAFPRLAIGLSVLMIILILIGLFVSKDERRYWLWGLGAIGFIIAIVVITQSFETFGLIGGNYDNYVGWVIGGVLIIGLIIAVAASSGDGSSSNTAPKVAVIGPWDKGE